MSLWSLLSGKDDREWAARRDQQRLEEGARINAVEAEGNYRSFLTAYLPEVWVCKSCGSVTADRGLHDAWHRQERTP